MSLNNTLSRIPSRESATHRVYIAPPATAGLLRLATRLLCVFAAAVSVSPVSHAQSWERPFAGNSIWNTRIGANPRYVACNLGVLGGIANDRMWLFRTYGNDPYRPVFQPEGYEKPGVNIWDSLWIPDEPNGCASFLLPDGTTLREYNALRRPDPAANRNPVGYYSGDHSLSGDGIRGGQAGSGMSTLGGSIRAGELESGNPIPHALKLELDAAVLYRNTGDSNNRQQTYRWPAWRSDGNEGGTGTGPGYGGSNSALRMGSLVALPKNVNIDGLGLSAKGRKIAQALQDYGAYIVDTTGNFWQWGNGGYTAAISVEAYASQDYFKNDNGYYNDTQLYYDMDKIYQRLAVVDDNGPGSIGGGGGPVGISNGIYKITSVADFANGRVLEVGSGKRANPDGATVNLWDWNGGGFQRWNVQSLGNNQWRLDATHTGQSLDAYNNDVVGVWDWWGGNMQRWELNGNGDGTYRIQSVQHPGYTLSAHNNVSVGLWYEWFGGAQQRWRFDPMCLTATYWDNADFTGPFYVRRDPTVNFDWGTGSPMPAKIATETFSVRWTGKVIPKFSQAYKFYVKANDGVRLWVNGVKLIDRWGNASTATENASADITLNANQKYDIKLEYYDNIGNASCQLYWSSPSQAKQIVPDNCTLPY